MPRIGEMDRSIRLEVNTPSAGSTYGEKVDNWTTLATVWAKVEPLSGTESKDTQQVFAEQMARFTIRFRTDVDATNRIVYNSKIFNIHAALELGRQDFLEITASVINP